LFAVGAGLGLGLDVSLGLGLGAAWCWVGCVGGFAGGVEEFGFGVGELGVFGGGELVDVVGGAEGGGGDLLVDGGGLDGRGWGDGSGSVGVDCLEGRDGALELGGVGDGGELGEGEVVELADLVRGVGWVEEVGEELGGEGPGRLLRSRLPRAFW